MEVFAGLSAGLLMLVALFVATRTFALWRRTRGLPELLLGLYLSCATVLGYSFMILGTQISTTEIWPLIAGGQVSMSVGFTCLLLFTWKVFRPDALWAKGLVGVALLLFGSASIAYLLEVMGENPRPAAELVGVNLLSVAPIAVAYFWTTAESLSYHRRLQLQLRLGLTEVAVANRVLLWAYMALAAGIAVLVNLAAMLTGSFLTPPVVVVSSSLGLVHASCLFLAFHPPRWYASWLDRRYAAERG